MRGRRAIVGAALFLTALAVVDLTAASMAQDDPITGSNGRFAIENAPVGRVRVSVVPFGRDAPYGPADHTAVIEAGRANDLGDLAVPRRRPPERRDR